MKTIKYFALVSFAGLASADFANMQAQMTNLVGNGSTSAMRAWDGKNAETIQNLDEYGCWCYFLDNVGRGKGTPVDEIDAMCKILHDGYECAVLDSEAEGIDCAPWDQTYHSGTGSLEEGENLLTRCQKLNPDNACEWRSCTVEGFFIENLLAALISGAKVDYEAYGHGFGFDPSPAAGCPVKKPQSVSNTRECCGKYPIRFPYKTLDGERSCCGTRTYNTNLLNCCGGGQVKANC